jgi:hypothetical protein
MYALFFEETYEPIGVFDSKNQAVAMGKLMSRERSRAVVGIFNAADGSTAVCCKFSAGEQTFDGGSCATVSAQIASQAMLQDNAV